MRYRALSTTGDYQLGRAGLFLIDSPSAVAQAIKTRLLLWAGEWFLNSAEGTPYEQSILGYGTQTTRDLAIKERILGTPGVVQLIQYASSVSGQRKMTVTATVETLYGPASITIQV